MPPGRASTHACLPLRPIELRTSLALSCDPCRGDEWIGTPFFEFAQLSEPATQAHQSVEPLRE